jgi:hypothetical protein
VEGGSKEGKEEKGDDESLEKKREREVSRKATNFAKYWLFARYHS